MYAGLEKCPKKTTNKSIIQKKNVNAVTTFGNHKVRSNDVFDTKHTIETKHHLGGVVGGSTGPKTIFEVSKLNKAINGKSAITGKKMYGGRWQAEILCGIDDSEYLLVGNCYSNAKENDDDVNFIPDNKPEENPYSVMLCHLENAPK